MKPAQNNLSPLQEFRGIAQKKCSVNLWKLLHTAANDNHIPTSYWVKRVLLLSLLFGFFPLLLRILQ